jgi:glycerol transport system substrate-binding protein
VSGKLTPAQTMHQLASAMDNELQKIGQEDYLRCRPVLNTPESAATWLARPGAPKPKVNEKPQGRTLSYEEAIRAWQ